MKDDQQISSNGQTRMRSPFAAPSVQLNSSRGASSQSRAVRSGGQGIHNRSQEHHKRRLRVM
eukprot:14539058-Heterocapsa_arctica.AAC.1